MWATSENGGVWLYEYVIMDIIDNDVVAESTCKTHEFY